VLGEKDGPRSTVLEVPWNPRLALPAALQTDRDPGQLVCALGTIVTQGILDGHKKDFTEELAQGHVLHTGVRLAVDEIFPVCGKLIPMEARP
jgi:hypothetical protein